ncbi:MAG: metallophosphoesterase [Candidatus Eremiobacteraeota bacterium]|nr:metallophosphoesterase [Candidatus Eremiobacteraeota bacterium]
MRIAFTSDLHVDITRPNKELVPRLAEALAALEPQVFVLLGDVAPSLEVLGETLSALSSLPCTKLFVAGNHDVWSLGREAKREGETLEKYESQIPSLCRSHGFLDLHQEAVTVNGCLFTGTMGWFDYSLRNASLDRQITQEDYEAGLWRNLRWNDFIYTDWSGIPPVQNFRKTARGVHPAHVTQWMVQSLREKLALHRGAPQTPTVVASHFLPVKDILRYSHEPHLDFSCAFLGSEAFGEVIRDFPSIRYWLFGHIHRKVSLIWRGVNLMSSPVGYLRGLSPDLNEVAREAISLIEI